MTSPDTELLQIADILKIIENDVQDVEISDPIREISQAVNNIGRSWSGSWLGYHANVYYENLIPPPSGAHFSQEWGLIETMTSLGSTGNWKEYSKDEIEYAIAKNSKHSSLASARNLESKAEKIIDKSQSEILSIIETHLSENSDSFLERLRDDLIGLHKITDTEIIKKITPTNQFMTRDTTALGQGIKTPPHIAVGAEITAIQATFRFAQELESIARKAGSHIFRSNKNRQKFDRIGTNIFIGHGRSLIWRELKDFIEDRLQLPVDEFNRIPVAGVTNIARLSEMLDSAALAFILMTGEDEQSDGRLHARMNVVHESGLFQGRLGFSRAIVVLEEDCEAFSNIDGLGQIRFPKGNIKAAFEDIRSVLEREGLSKPG